jgi:ABC-2 type transport system permease protein
MRKIFVIALREYRSAVKTKSFIISLILVPVLMGGSLAVSILTEDKVDTADKKYVVLDHSQLFSEALQQRVRQHNESEIFKPGTQERIRPTYSLEFLNPESSELLNQKHELSEKVRSKELAGFLEIGPSVLHPDADPPNAYVRFYSESSFLDEAGNWFAGPINDHLRLMRMHEMNLAADSIKELFYYANVENMGLVTFDTVSGNIRDAEKSNPIQSLLIPYILVMLMFMLGIMGSTPLITAVMEEKMEKIAEVLLATVTPAQFMAGKVLGSACVSLTTAAIYIIAGMLTANQLGFTDMIPYNLVAWFFIFLIFFLIMMGSLFTSLGAACNDNKDAQNVSFPAMMPMILPLFVIMPVLKNPAGDFATWLSLFPPFTPMLMITRMATPVTIPAWQPIAGLLGVIVFTSFAVWAGSRIFRTGILMQGQKPTLGNLFKYAFKG